MDVEGKNPIDEWIARLSDEARDQLNSMLKNDRKIADFRRWSGFRHKMGGKEGKLGLYELGFRCSDGVQYRLLVKFDGPRRAVLICGYYHKGNVYTPHGALDSSRRRAQALDELRSAQERAGIEAPWEQNTGELWKGEPRERKIKEDI